MVKSMNGLTIVDSPKLKFIIPEHKLDFIDNVFDIYRSEVEGLAITKKWMPEISNILSEIEERFILGGTLTRRSGDPSLYTRDEANIPPTHRSFWASMALDELSRHFKDMDIDYYMLRDDLEKVLNHYHISYIEEKVVQINSKWVDVMLCYNSPIFEIW